MKIKLDAKNFNRHTDAGMKLLEKSISEVGAIESIAVDKNGEIITGNARFETFEKLGYKPKIVELGENEYPVIQTDLNGEKRVKAAILANTTAQMNMNLDYDLIQEVAVEEFNIDVEDVGVEIIDISEITKYNPNTTPSTNNNLISEKEIELSQKKIDAQFNNLYQNKSEHIKCICPECFYEFEVKI